MSWRKVGPSARKFSEAPPPPRRDLSAAARLSAASLAEGCGLRAILGRVRSLWSLYCDRMFSFTLDAENFRLKY
jgi:hypothetical protein